MGQEYIDSGKFASFGAIHLNNTSLEKSRLFWTKIIGMELKEISETVAKFGTATQVLVVVHQTAETSFQKGYSGLYHFAVHVSKLSEFAGMIQRLIDNNYPFSPVDHTMSKSIYLEDPDGINIELTIETPERFKRVVAKNGLRIEDSEGNLKNASEHLVVSKVLEFLEFNTTPKKLSKDAHIGHLHLYANSIEDSNQFYKKIGFIPFNYLPQYLYADLGAGGHYKHRIALNCWHGVNRPLAPNKNAGMRYFQINFSTQEKLTTALKNVSEYTETNGTFWTHDSIGNQIAFTSL
ncbi:glyoxalase [Polaribacter pacificus]|uniref:Glyoxalase n=1 Tax=Polaribacter pacificus TaxID=1775173 RepID=A0A917MDV8_9FLAO|nr:VOC family protein [Polaribacter pacificus]GGG97944.1 glyoxalase [Polaribacter pacificus]